MRPADSRHLPAASALVDQLRGRALQTAAAKRVPRRYPGIDAALERMRAANPRLDADYARHVTEHGLKRNEDGSWSWKFDPLLHVMPAFDMEPGQVQELWQAIECPTLLCYGRESWASNPATDGRAAHFRNARVELFDGAGHWVHVDQREAFLAELAAFHRAAGAAAG